MEFHHFPVQTIAVRESALCQFCFHSFVDKLSILYTFFLCLFCSLSMIGLCVVLLLLCCMEVRAFQN